MLVLNRLRRLNKNLWLMRLYLLLTIGVLVAYPAGYNFWFAFNHSPLGGAIYFTCLLGSVGLLGASVWRPDWTLSGLTRIIERIPRLAWWLVALLFWLQLAQLGAVMAAKVEFAALVAFYLWLALSTLVLIWLGARHAPVQPVEEAPPTTKRRIPLVIAALSGSAAIARDVFLVTSMGIITTGDTDSYEHAGETLFDFSRRLEMTIRTLPYPLMNAVTDTAHGFTALIWLQILIGALAIAFLVFTVSRRSVLVGITLGFLLALDTTWGSMNITAMTESPFMSFSMLSLAFLIDHYDWHAAVRWWELLLVGALYGWTALIRPAGLGLSLLIVMAYWWITRSWRKTAIVASGIMLLWLAAGLTTYWRSGSFNLVRGAGYFTYVPLLRYRLLDPNDGSASRQLFTEFTECNVFDSTRFYGVDMNQYDECMGRRGRSIYDSGDVFRDAYYEAITAHPIKFAGIVVTEQAYYLAAHTTPTDLAVAAGGATVKRLQWLEFMTSQVYVLLFLQPVNSDVPLGATAAWLVMVGFLIITNGRLFRFVTVACASMIHYLQVTTIIAQVIIPRYVYILSPFHIVLSALVYATLIRTVHQEWTRQTNLSK